MSAPILAETEEHDGPPFLFIRPIEPEPHGQTLICCGRGAMGTVNQCATCQGPISLGCEESWHVARCTTSDGYEVCGRMYSTIWGCRKHPYRDGHNPEMRVYSNSIKPRIPGALANPTLEKLKKQCAEWAIQYPVKEYKKIPWSPYKGSTSTLPEGMKLPEKVSETLAEEQQKVAEENDK